MEKIFNAYLIQTDTKYNYLLAKDGGDWGVIFDTHEHEDYIPYFLYATEYRDIKQYDYVLDTRGNVWQCEKVDMDNKVWIKQLGTDNLRSINQKDFEVIVATNNKALSPYLKDEFDFNYVGGRNHYHVPKFSYDFLYKLANSPTISIAFKIILEVDKVDDFLIVNESNEVSAKIPKYSYTPQEVGVLLNKAFGLKTIDELNNFLVENHLPEMKRKT